MPVVVVAVLTIRIRAALVVAAGAAGIIWATSGESAGDTARNATSSHTAVPSGTLTAAW